jgi:hypothetical protein
MTDKESMAMALEALETLMIERGSIYEKAIAALKERLAQPHETTLKEFNQFIHDDPKYHIWAKEKEALAEKSMREMQRLGQEIEQEPICPKCKAAVLYECVACSSNNYPPQRTEENFCPRCGKRTNDIHTCTPPKD